MYCRYAIDFAIFAKEFLCINQENKFHHITRITSLIYIFCPKKEPLRCQFQRWERHVQVCIVFYYKAGNLIHAFMYLSCLWWSLHTEREMLLRFLTIIVADSARSVVDVEQNIEFFFGVHIHIIALHFMFEYLKTTCENYMKIHIWYVYAYI